MKENMFVEAFKKGQENYKKMLEDIGEIQYVLNNLEEQLNTISKNKLNITYSNNSLLFNNKEICPFVVKAGGYPIKIHIRNRTTYCEDKESLEDIIMDILRDFELNDKIAELMNN